jgi:hypothetical protein
LHLRSGDDEKTPYRSYAEARYAAALFGAYAETGETLAAPAVPCLYLFPPEGDIDRVEIQELEI